MCKLFPSTITASRSLLGPRKRSQESPLVNDDQRTQGLDLDQRQSRQTHPATTVSGGMLDATV